MCEVTRGATVCQQEEGHGLFRDFEDLSTCSWPTCWLAGDGHDQNWKLRVVVYWNHRVQTIHIFLRTFTPFSPCFPHFPPPSTVINRTGQLVSTSDVFSQFYMQIWKGNPMDPSAFLCWVPQVPPQVPRARFQVWLQAALSREEDKCTKTASEANGGSSAVKVCGGWGLKRFGILKLTKDDDNDSPMIMIMTNWWLIMTWVIVKLW